jgi:Uncharacterized conserved protein (DUF2304)
MPPLPYAGPLLIGSVSWQARSFTLACGIVLSLWTLTKLRNRALLVPICSLFITVGLGLITFSAAPMFFDTLAYSVGVQYPPLVYLIVAILLLMAIIVVFAIKLSSVDERCRRLAQELALMRRAEIHNGQASK